MGMKEFISSLLATVAVETVADAVNKGRTDTFTEFSEIEDEIAFYQWSTILDAKTCARCEELDGLFFEKGSQDLVELEPPLHPSCRCIVVATLKDEVQNEPIEFTKLSPDRLAYLLENKI